MFDTILFFHLPHEQLAARNFNKNEKHDQEEGDFSVKNLSSILIKALDNIGTECQNKR